MGGLLKAITDRKQLRLTERRTQEGQCREVVSCEPSRYDKIRKARKVCEVHGTSCSATRWVRRRGKEWRALRQCGIDDREDPEWFVLRFGACPD
jgi:hypothetical protein